MLTKEEELPPPVPFFLQTTKRDCGSASWDTLRFLRIQLGDARWKVPPQLREEVMGRPQTVQLQQHKEEDKAARRCFCCWCWRSRGIRYSSSKPTRAKEKPSQCKQADDLGGDFLVIVTQFVSPSIPERADGRLNSRVDRYRGSTKPIPLQIFVSLTLAGTKDAVSWPWSAPRTGAKMLQAFCSAWFSSSWLLASSFEKKTTVEYCSSLSNGSVSKMHQAWSNSLLNYPYWI